MEKVDRATFFHLGGGGGAMNGTEIAKKIGKIIMKM
jgi:hypothetical protein